ncbi:hypothetical protein AB0M39_21080 [Streptomyces sp. NPDC051907]|uniref:hypothetical protein n=1 Tax=Streptomyces sp. NPDC051907 TaxID=3155284 RepID=UPI00342B448C
MDRLKRHAGKLAAAACALLLLAAGAFWISGGYDRWSTERLLKDACDGVLPVDEVRAVLGDRNLEEGRMGDHSEGALNDEKTSLRVECTISRQVERNAGKPARDASVTVTVSGVPTVNPRDRHPEVYPSLRSELPPSPLGEGWNGAFAASDGGDGDAESTAAVLLACARGRSDLLVTAAVEAEDSTLDDPEIRADFARIATVTAANASRHFGCDADLGRPLTTAPLSVNKDEHLPLAEAKGTCAGVPGHGQSTARAWESRRGAAPLEECALGDDQGQLTYVLKASFGPYAEGERYQNLERGHLDRARADARSGELRPGRWTSAACAGGDEPAFFSVVPYGTDRDKKTSAADDAYERSALKSFAERSAKAHGCSTPAAP